MARCEATISEIRFDISDETVTHVYVLVTARGDCPRNTAGWHHKTFPITMPVTEIIANFMDDYLSWDIKSPDMKKSQVVGVDITNAP